MIRQAEHASNAWTPYGFEEVTNFYSATPWVPIPDSLNLSPAFRRCWDCGDLPATHADIAVVLTPGLFSEWLPGCFSSVRRAFAEAGHRVLQSRVRSSVGVLEQADKLGVETSQWLNDDELFIWCGHSKGGLELLLALERFQSLQERCIGAVVVQPPVGLSPVVARLVSGQASLSQRLSGRALRSRLFSGGVRDISADRDPELTNWLKRFTPVVPVLNAVSWSIEPTSWIDSWHRTLGEACPGIAHDGQFLTHEQRLPNTPIVALPRIDHAQPVLGGNGFDVARFWQALVSTAAHSKRATQTR